MLAELLEARADRERALDRWTEAARLWHRIDRAQPDRPDNLAALVKALFRAAVLCNELGRPREALDTFTKARQVSQRLLKARPEDCHHRAELATILFNMGTLYQGAGRSKEALARFAEAIAFQQKLVKDHPNEDTYQADLASSLSNEAAVRALGGEDRRGLIGLRQARDLLVDLVKRHPDNLRYQSELANTLNNIGNIERKLGRPKAALDSVEQAMPLLRRVRTREPDSPVYRLWQRNGHMIRAAALTDLKRHREAAREWAEVARLETAPRDHATWLLRQAQALVQAGDYRESVELAQQLAAMRSPSGETLYNLACVHSMAAAAAARDESRPLPQRQKDAESWAVEAVRLLRQAERVGFFKHRPYVLHLKKDSDLDFLRSRDDFRQWLKRLESHDRAP
jgi:tetratricopeptide (TPR) repeat protein